MKGEKEGREKSATGKRHQDKEVRTRRTKNEGEKYKENEKDIK